MPVKRTEQKSAKAPVARKPATRRKRTPAISHEDIAVRAYYLHTEGGHDPHENWIRAERELTGA
jgi:hypothetical protein